MRPIIRSQTVSWRVNRDALALVVSLVLVGCASAEESGNIYSSQYSCGQNAKQPGKQALAKTRYQAEALKAVLYEATHVARELNLPEKLPITENELRTAFVSPSEMAKLTGAIGNVSTSNYTYYVSLQNKFCFVEGTHIDSDLQKWRSQYLWPVSRVDTNAAYQLAKDWLTYASMDIKALERDCQLHIVPNASFRSGTNSLFLPVYWVYWTKGTRGSGSVASVQLFAPTRTLMQMRVEDPNYILRKPLQVTNLNSMVSIPEQKAK